MALNTYEFFETADEEYQEMVKDDFSEEDMRQVEDGEACLTKWLSDEWGYSDDESDELSKISQSLYKKEASNPEEYYSAKKLNSEKVYEQFLSRKELEEESN